MRFDFVDRVIEKAGDRIVTVKHVSPDEDYLRDHFPSFPVLPGVLMLECMVQAARCLLDGRGEPLVLGSVRALKYGRFVRPGDDARVEVRLVKALDDGSVEFRGEVRVEEPGGAAPTPPAAAGKFTLRPSRAVGGR